MKPWLRRLLLGTGILLVVLALSASLIVRQIAVHRAERDFPPPARLVEFDGHRSHIYCSGQGSPTILLESGLDDRGSWGWEHLRDELSQISRVCAYDRAGIMWSERRDGPRDAERIADELHALLAAAAEPPPYVLVGHSLGGLLVRVFDARYPGEAVGFVFVDASHPEQDGRFPAEVRQLIEERKAKPDRRWLLRILAPYRIFAPEVTNGLREVINGVTVMRSSGAFIDVPVAIVLILLTVANSLARRRDGGRGKYLAETLATWGAFAAAWSYHQGLRFGRSTPLRFPVRSEPGPVGAVRDPAGVTKAAIHPSSRPRAAF